MTIPTWPTEGNFPQVAQKGFQESVGINVLRSATDSGPAKQRRRGARLSVMDLSFIMTTAQTEILEAFINDTLEGVKRFTFPHPRLYTEVGGVQVPKTIEVRIVVQGDGEFYKLQYLAPGFWQTSLKFEILP